MRSLAESSREKNVSLRGAIFPPDFQFWRLFKIELPAGPKEPRVWEGQLDLTGATFLGLVNFSRLTYNGTVHLSDATFSGEAWFNHAVFRGGVFCGGTTFKGTIKLIEAEFNEEFQLWNAKFCKEVIFKSARFRKEATFLDTTIQGEINFDGARFEGDAVFHSVVAKDIGFSKVMFAGVVFSGYPDKPLFQNANVNVINTIFLKPNLARFDYVDLRRCNFLGTDVRGIDFSGARWEEGGLWFWRRSMVYAPVSERYIRRELENLYRQIRQSYEDHRNYPEAGDFYYGEMDQKRKRHWARRYLPSLITLYWICSGYGQRPVQAGILFLLLLAGFTGVLLSLGLINMVDSSPYSVGPSFWEGSGKFFRAMWAYTFRAAILGDPLYLKPQCEFGEFVTTLARIIIPIQAALFVLAVTRRFKR